MTRLLFLLDHARRGVLLLCWWMTDAARFGEPVIVLLTDSDGETEGLVIARNEHTAWQATKDRRNIASGSR